MTREPLLSAIILGISLVAAAWIGGQALVQAKTADRVVNVKGLSEREVTADLAIWKLKATATGSDLREVQAALTQSVTRIVTFLKSQGFTQEEIAIGEQRVVDLMAREYRSNENHAFRYIIEGNVTLRSGKPALVDKVSRMTASLVEQGITLADSNIGVQYHYTKLNEVKPDMLREATQNARAAAQQFAEDSGANVGAIKTANQGVFSILSQDGQVENAYDQNNPSTMIKRLRVVATVEYYLED